MRSILREGEGEGTILLLLQLYNVLYMFLKNLHSLVQNLQSSAGGKDGFEMTERIKGVLEVVYSHTTVPHSSERQSKSCSSSSSIIAYVDEDEGREREHNN